MSGYNSHHWGAPTASGQSTGEAGNPSGRYGSSLEMEPMISASGNTKGAGSPGSSKYHGKRTSPGSAGRMVLVTLACLAMLYFGYGVGRDDGLETAKQPNASPTPSLVRKPPAVDQSKEVKPDMTDRTNDDDDEPSDEDAEDDQMLESTGSAEERDEVDAQENDGSKPVGEDPADAVTEDEAAREDDEDEDDDATQDFAPDGDSNNDNADVTDAEDDDDDDSVEDDGDDDSTEDFDDEAKDGHVDVTPGEKLAQQNLEDDDSVVDDDTVSQDADTSAGGSSDNGDENDQDANAIAKKLVPNGVSDTPTTAYQIPDTVHNRFVKWSKELHQISEMEEYKGGEPRVNWEWHPRKRADRFPGVDDRVSSFTFDNTTG